MSILLIGLHLFDNRSIIFDGLINVVLDTVHSTNDIVSSSVIAVHKSKLIRVAGVFKQVLETSEVLSMYAISAEFDLLVVGEVKCHVLFGVTRVSNFVQV